MTTSTPDRVDAPTVRTWLTDHAGADKVTVLDVRTPAEFETVRIPGSINVPLPLVEKHAGQLAARLHRDVVLVCQSGARATQAQQRLAGVGAERLHVLDGGVPAYETAGGSVVRGPARWALERQVRLVAGTLVLTSIAASLRWPTTRFVAGGIGAGLTISALTDTCTMGRVLAALPYNRGPRQPNPAEILDQLPGPPATP
ncbi:MAG: rhodanese-like domain-containing protein [Actinomycetota bacterium]|nr:rhodanese-like domain-containing protein [Actinomycetota bacterium]